MRAVDTNVLARALIDDPQEADEVKLARSWLAVEKAVLVQNIVLAELAWVMRSAYGLARAHVGQAIRAIIAHSRYRLEDPGLVQAAIDLFDNSTVDFADCLLLCGARTRGSDLVTFDRKLARFPGAIRLTAALQGKGEPQ